jgi:hypothetical protein
MREGGGPAKTCFLLIQKNPCNTQSDAGQLASCNNYSPLQGGMAGVAWLCGEDKFEL